MRKRKTAGLVALILLLTFCFSACQESTEAKYDRAQRLLTEEKYFEASTLFDEVSTYEDSSKMSMYAKAIALAESGEFDTAFSCFRSLGDYKDCSLMITYYTGRKNESQASVKNWSLWIIAAEYYDMNAFFLDSSVRAEACRKAVYNDAVHLAGNGEFEQAAEMLDKLADYSDSANLKKYYTAFKLEQEERFAEASAVFTELGNYRNSAEQVEKVLKRGYDKADVLEKAGNQEEASAVFASLGDFEDAFERANKPYYDQGITKREEKDWYTAIKAFEKAGTYSDAETQILETKYQQAEYKREQKNWDEAAGLFAELKEYKDSALQVNETRYQQASALEENGDRENAYNLFTSLGRYKDAYDRANKPYYDLGVSKRESQEWDEAIAAFTKIVNYSDAAEQINETYYQQASATEAAGDQEGAYELFLKLGEYSDAYERANRPYYELGIAKREAGEWEEAIDAFTHIAAYSDAAEQIKATYYAEGQARRTAKDWEAARAAFANAGDYSDAGEQILTTWYHEGKDGQEVQDWNRARAAFVNAGNYSDAGEQILATWYLEGKAAQEAKDWNRARTAFTNAGNYSDAGEQILATWYYEGKAAQEAQDWDSARTAFENAGEYADAKEQIPATWYSEGEAKRAEQAWESARTAFANAGGYGDASEQIKETSYMEAAALETTDPQRAISIYTGLGEYSDAPERTRKIWYDTGLKKQEEKEWDEAVYAFTQAGDYSDALTQVSATRFLEGEGKREEQDWDGAVDAFRASGDYGEAARMIEECLYQKTIDLLNKYKTGKADSQQVIDALLDIHDEQLFIRARGSLTEGNVFHEAWAKGFTEGNTIRLGKYEQDNNPDNGSEPISWRIICSRDGKALLLSEKVIDAMPFMTGKRRTELSNLNADGIWKQSEVFQWISGVFGSCFSEQEAAMFTAHETGDMLFILDNKEYKMYCSGEDSSSVAATEYALSKDKSHHNLLYYKKDSSGDRVPGTSVMWWIRTGAIKEEGYLYPDDLGMTAGIRPAAWISYEQGPTEEWIEEHFPAPET